MEKARVLPLIFIQLIILVGITKNGVAADSNKLFIEVGIYSVQESTPHVYNYWTEIFHQIKVIYHYVQGVDIVFLVTKFTTIKQMPDDQIQRMMNDDGFDEVYTKQLLESTTDTPNLDVTIIHHNASTGFEKIYHRSSHKCINSTPTIGGVILFTESPKKFVFNIALELGKIIKSLDNNTPSEECSDLSDDALFYNNGNGRRHLLSCLDQYFYNFTSSHASSCIRKFSLPSQPPPFDFEYDTGFQCTTLEKECRDLVGGHATFRPLTQEDKQSCRNVNCGPITFDRFDGSDCRNGGRCFDGECMEPGHLLVNVATGRCLVASDRFKGHDVPLLIPCPSSSFITQRWHFSGQKMQTVFINKDYPQHNELKYKCLAHTFNSTANVIETTACKSWSQVDWKLTRPAFAKGVYFLYNLATNSCVSVDSGSPVMTPNCNEINSANLWKLFPTNCKCENQNYTADLKLSVSEPKFIQSSYYDQRILLDVNLKNLGYPAVAPWVSVSFNASLILLNATKKCFPYYENGQRKEYICKVGRLLARDDTVDISPLEFRPIRYSPKLSANYVFNFSALSATKLAKPVNKLVEIGYNDEDSKSWKVIIIALFGIAFLLIAVIIMTMTFCTKKLKKQIKQRDLTTNEETPLFVIQQNNGGHVQLAPAIEPAPALAIPAPPAQIVPDVPEPVPRFEVVIGSDECKFPKLMRILSSIDTFTQLQDSWSDLAIWLEIDPAKTDEIRRDLLNGRIEIPYAIGRILIEWKEVQSNRATLQRLLNILEQHQQNHIATSIRNAFLSEPSSP